MSRPVAKSNALVAWLRKHRERDGQCKHGSGGPCGECFAESIKNAHSEPKRVVAPVLVDVAMLDEIEALLRLGFDDGACDGTGDGDPEMAATCTGCRAVRVLKALGRWTDGR